MECFVTYSKDIEGRFDPHYYRPSFIKLADELNQKSTVKISDIARVICGPFGSTITLKDYGKEGVPLIRISNVREDVLVHDDLVFISNDKADELNSYKVKENDLIISQRGTLGLVAKVGSNFSGAIISANFIAIKDIKKLNPDYLKTFLSSDFGRQQLTRRTSGQVQTKLTTDDIKRIRIPLIPPSLQNQVITIMQSAYQQKRHKEIEAQKLLDSIDGYVLAELGIIASEMENRICYLIKSEVITDRIDPEHYLPIYTEIINSIEKGKYPLRRINEVAERIVRKFEPQAGKEYDYVQLGCIDRSLGRITQTLKITMPNIPSRAQQVVKHNEILFSTSLPQMGAHALAEREHDNSVVSSGFTIIRVTNCNTDYLLAVLRLKLYLNFYQKYLTGAGLFKTISNSDLLNIRVPHPPIEVQQNIAGIVKNRMQKAETLQQEAKAEFEKTKAEIEKIILGES